MRLIGWNVTPSKSWYLGFDLPSIKIGKCTYSTFGIGIGRMYRYELHNCYYNELYIWLHIGPPKWGISTNAMIWDYGAPAHRPDLWNLRSGQTKTG